MDRDQSIALWQKGKEAWNAWARRMLARRAEMEQAGVWQVEKKNEETNDWITKASVDFFGLSFIPKGSTSDETDGVDERALKFPGGITKSLPVDGTSIDFADFIFPWLCLLSAEFRGEVDFRGAQFYGLTLFALTRFHGAARFENAEFYEPAVLDSARFYCVGGFEGARFYSRVYFLGASFDGKAIFRRAEFQDQAIWKFTRFKNLADFAGVRFKEMATFHGAHFDGANDFGEKTKFQSEADFAHANFHGRASFSGTQFEAATGFSDAHFYRGASFAHASLAGATSFKGAIFYTDDTSQKVADFTAIKADRAFDLNEATFSKPPTFSQADFKQSPDLDKVHFPLPPPWERGDEELAAEFRHIRRLALQGHDYEQEHRAFKGELRSRRGNIDCKYGLNFLYDIFSDCGRSIWRPFLLWVLALFGSAVAYLWNAGIGFANWRSLCWANESSVGWKALSLSIANALPVIGPSRPEEIRSIYACLYGVPRVTQGSQQFDIPPWSPVIQVGQNVVSAILIFLFLLAIRNQFKIK